MKEAFRQKGVYRIDGRSELSICRRGRFSRLNFKKAVRLLINRQINFNRQFARQINYPTIHWSTFPNGNGLENGHVQENNHGRYILRALI